LRFAAVDQVISPVVKRIQRLVDRLQGFIRANACIVVKANGIVEYPVLLNFEEAANWFAEAVKRGDSEKDDDTYDHELSMQERHSAARGRAYNLSAIYRQSDDIARDSDHRRYQTKTRYKLGIECPTKLFYTGKKKYFDSPVKCYSMSDIFFMVAIFGTIQIFLNCLIRYFVNILYSFFPDHSGTVPFASNIPAVWKVPSKSNSLLKKEAEQTGRLVSARNFYSDLFFLPYHSPVLL
jgi:hypothetical protein